MKSFIKLRIDFKDNYKIKKLKNKKKFQKKIKIKNIFNKKKNLNNKFKKRRSKIVNFRHLDEIKEK